MEVVRQTKDLEIIKQESRVYKVLYIRYSKYHIGKFHSGKSYRYQRNIRNIFKFWMPISECK